MLGALQMGPHGSPAPCLREAGGSALGKGMDRRKTMSSVVLRLLGGDGGRSDAARVIGCEGRAAALAGSFVSPITRCCCGRFCWSRLV